MYFSLLLCLLPLCMGQQTILQFIGANPRFSQFNTIVNANNDLTNLLSGNQQHTVFVVPDANFPSAGSAELLAIQNNAQAAARTIRLHIVQDTSATLSAPVDGVQFASLSAAQLVWGVTAGATTVRGVDPNIVQNVANLENTVPTQLANGLVYVVGPLLTFRTAQTVAPTPDPDPLGAICIDGECSEDSVGCIDQDQLILRSRRINRNDIVSLTFVNVRPPSDDADDDVNNVFSTIDDGDVDDENVVGGNDNTLRPEDSPTCDQQVQVEDSLQCRLNITRKLRGSRWRITARINGVDFQTCNNLTVGYFDPHNKDTLFGGDVVGFILGGIIMFAILLAAILPALMAQATPPPAFLPEEVPIAVETPNLVDILPAAPLAVPIGGPPFVAPMGPISPGPLGGFADPGFSPIGF